MLLIFLISKISPSLSCSVYQDFPFLDTLSLTVFSPVPVLFRKEGVKRKGRKHRCQNCLFGKPKLESKPAWDQIRSHKLQNQCRNRKPVWPSKHTGAGEIQWRNQKAKWAKDTRVSTEQKSAELHKVQNKPCVSFRRPDFPHLSMWDTSLLPECLRIFCLFLF